MTATTPAHAIELLDDAFNTGDLETILSLYDSAAVLLNGPGQETHGPEAIRDFYAGLLHHGLAVRQLKTHMVEADGIALFTSRWTLTAGDAAPQTFISSVVLRQQSDGSWKNLIDSARGPDVLGPA